MYLIILNSFSIHSQAFFYPKFIHAENARIKTPRRTNEHVSDLWLAYKRFCGNSARFFTFHASFFDGEKSLELVKPRIIVPVALPPAWLIVFGFLFDLRVTFEWNSFSQPGKEGNSSLRLKNLVHFHKNRTWFCRLTKCHFDFPISRITNPLEKRYQWNGMRLALQAGWTRKPARRCSKKKWNWYTYNFHTTPAMNLFCARNTSSGVFALYGVTFYGENANTQREGKTQWILIEQLFISIKRMGCGAGGRTSAFRFHSQRCGEKDFVLLTRVSGCAIDIPFVVLHDGSVTRSAGGEIFTEFSEKVKIKLVHQS